MEITWYGHSCFRLTERSLATVVTDPYDSESTGYPALKLPRGYRHHQPRFSEPQFCERSQGKVTCHHRPG